MITCDFTKKVLALTFAYAACTGLGATQGLVAQDRTAPNTPKKPTVQAVPFGSPLRLELNDGDAPEYQGWAKADPTGNPLLDSIHGSAIGLHLLVASYAEAKDIVDAPGAYDVTSDVVKTIALDRFGRLTGELTRCDNPGRLIALATSLMNNEYNALFADTPGYTEWFSAGTLLTAKAYAYLILREYLTGQGVNGADMRYKPIAKHVFGMHFDPRCGTEGWYLHEEWSQAVSEVMMLASVPAFEEIRKAYTQEGFWAEVRGITGFENPFESNTPAHVFFNYHHARLMRAVGRAKTMASAECDKWIESFCLLF